MSTAQSKILRAAATAVLLAAVQVIAAQQASRPKEGKSVDIAFTYAAQRSNSTGGNSFWLQGGGAQIAGTFYHGLGAVADVTATHASNIQSTGVNLTLLSTTFGLRYTHPLPFYKSLARPITAFGEALGGIANGFGSVIPSSGGAQSSAEGAAFQMGGGVDMSLHHHLALRLVQAHWLHTSMPNGTTGAQNNLVIGAGIVYRISRESAGVN